MTYFSSVQKWKDTLKTHCIFLYFFSRVVMGIYGFDLWKDSTSTPLDKEDSRQFIGMTW